MRAFFLALFAIAVLAKGADEILERQPWSAQDKAVRGDVRLD